jgi:hypothetical protein
MPVNTEYTECFIFKLNDVVFDPDGFLSIQFDQKS